MLDLIKMITVGVVGTITVATVGYFLGPVKSVKGGSKGQRIEEMEEDDMGNSPETEQLFQKLIQELNEAIMSRNIDLADQRAAKLLDFAKGFGEKSLNYGFVVGIPLANYYEAKGDMKALESALKEAADIIIKSGSKELAVDTGILDKLTTIYFTKPDYAKVEKYSLIIAEVRKEQLRLNRTSDTTDKFGLAANRAGLALSQIGKFKEAQVQFQEALKIFQENTTASPFASQTLEYFSNMLHQQGKTRDAVQELNIYLQKTSKQNDPKKTKLAILRRIATLLFTIDEFQEAAKYLKRILDDTTDQNTELLCLAELANCYWELDNEEEANKVQSNIKQRSPTNHTIPPTRSKYLSTVESTLDLNGYTLLMRVNREKPNRKQGEPLEEASSLQRKLNTCFLEIHYQTTTGWEIETYDVTTPHEFSLKSSKRCSVDISRWYEVIIYIYKDKHAYDTKQPRIGVHHQLAYTFPQPVYRIQ